MPQRGPARLQRRQSGRLRRRRPAHRHGPAAGQGTRFHAEVRRSALRPRIAVSFPSILTGPCSPARRATRDRCWRSVASPIPIPPARRCFAAAPGVVAGDPAWLADARACFDDRPASWAELDSATPGKLHPAEVFRDVAALSGERSGQRADLRRRGVRAMGTKHVAQRPADDQRCGRFDRVIIADGRPAARVVEQSAPIFAVLGDGTFGFHMSEIETAVRLNLPYRRDRRHGCALECRI